MKAILSVGLLVLGAANAYAELDLEMTGPEYRALLRSSGVEKSLKRDEPLAPVLHFGKRAMDWVSAVNATRGPKDRLELTTPESTSGIPIEQPNQSNREIVLKAFQDRVAAMPDAIRSVLAGATPLPSAPPTDDETFLTHLRAAVRSYEGASRWLLQEPSLSSYAARSSGDIRGHYGLSREPELATKLSAWSTLESSKREQLTEWLVGICHNSGKSRKACTSELASATEGGSAVAFYSRYAAVGKKTFEGYFRVVNPRPDGRWSDSARALFVQDFQTVLRGGGGGTPAEVQSWLVSNIEEEWRHAASQEDSFQLRLRFVSASRAPEVVFKAGATPHVNRLGGSTITMDDNRALEEYSVRWTIRHEFGHVLGFPDCYIEFYDADAAVMVNYQIDLDNLMCSRRGHLQAQHVDEFRRSYSATR